jgi:UDPglucose 6-dehydrogenase
MSQSIACIGQGFVGGSLTTVLAERGITVYTYDKTGKQVHGGTHSYVWPGPGRCQSIADLVMSLETDKGDPKITKQFSRIYFVCVPTPMYEDGSADTSIVEGVLNELSSVPGERIAVIKSTVPPGSTEKWNKQFANTGLKIVFNPEFLREATALDDMRNQTRIILGGPRPHINKVKQLFESTFQNVPIIKTSSTTAEMVKYFINVQLATRVVLSCEFWQLCNALDNKGFNIDFDKVVEYAKYDSRLGGSHMNVPGQDGIPGARGHCFPKDLAAIIAISKNLELNASLMQAVQTKNLELVPPEHRDWEKMIGRAVSSKKNK